MIFQDPLSALNPVHRIGDQIVEMIQSHQDSRKDAARTRAVELLDIVGIPQPKDRARQYPHEFSGGMRQRVMIAMAIANDPDVLIADEPTTALDVTVQAQILEVIQRIQHELNTAVVMITHDLGVVARVADRVQVMYAGRVVERARSIDLFDTPTHPYTVGLLQLAARARAGTAGADSGRAAEHAAAAERVCVPRSLRSRRRVCCRRSARTDAFGPSRPPASAARSSWRSE